MIYWIRVENITINAQPARHLVLLIAEHEIHAEIDGCNSKKFNGMEAWIREEVSVTGIADLGNHL